MEQTKESFLANHSVRYHAKDRTGSHYPFKDHHQFNQLIDILSRKYRHHAVLVMDFQAAIFPFYLEAFTQYLTHDNMPLLLSQREITHFLFDNINIPLTKQKSIEDELEHLLHSLDNSEHYCLFVVSANWLFQHDHKTTDDRFLRKHIRTLLTHPRCRFLVVAHAPFQVPEHEDEFVTLRINSPSNQDLMAILLEQRQSLETFHHVIIPEELLTQAYHLAERFLSTTHTLEQALLLLDSSAARLTNSPEAEQSSKPVLTSSTLLQVLASWTHIPPSSFQMHKFKLSEFTQHVQQRIFGQDLAVKIIAQELLQAQANLKRRQGPFCSFLFAGPTHCGKKTTAVAMVEQLFKQLNILFFAQPTLTQTSLIEMKVQSAGDKRHASLIEVIQQIPYAVIVFDHIDQTSPAILDGLQEIVSTGYLHDTTGKQYNFKQSIIILSTAKGTERLTFENTNLIDDTEEDIYTMDLMQLIMAEHKQEKYSPTQHPSPQEIRNKLLPAIADCLPQGLYQHLHFVPFLPLTLESAESIVRLKVKQLGKQLDARYGIEIGYAPEVPRFLAQEIVQSQSPEHAVTNPDHVLKQLYFCVEQALLSTSDQHRSNHLFLQLNETGHILRSEWVTQQQYGS